MGNRKEDREVRSSFPSYLDLPQLRKSRGGHWHSSHHCSRLAQVPQACLDISSRHQGALCSPLPRPLPNSGPKTAMPPVPQGSTARQLLSAEEDEASAFLCGGQGGEPASLLSCTWGQPSPKEPGLHTCQKQIPLNRANSTLAENLLLQQAPLPCGHDHPGVTAALKMCIKPHAR